MSAIWPELSELLLSAVPDTSVNMLHDELDSATPLALELRPKARTFGALTALPAKWTVIVFEVRLGVLSVTVVKMDRHVLDQREFDSSETMELAKFVKCQPLLNSKLAFCYGIRNCGVLQELNSMDHIGGKSIRRSAECKLLVAGKENDPGNQCKFCAFVDIDMMEDVDAAPVGMDNLFYVSKNIINTPGPLSKRIENIDLPTAPRTEDISVKQQVDLTKLSEGCFEDNHYEDNQTDSLSPKTPPLNLEPKITHHPPCGVRKPQLSYAQMIAEALMQAEDRMLPLCKIYTYINHKYPYFHMGIDSWKNAIRHTLTINPSFQKVPRPNNEGRGKFWTVEDGAERQIFKKTIHKMGMYEPEGSGREDQIVKEGIKEEPDLNNGDVKYDRDDFINSTNEESLAETTSQAVLLSDIDDKGWQEGFSPNPPISEVKESSCPSGKTRKLTYAKLIAEAINNSAKKMLPLSRIYAYITKHSYLEVEEKTWQNTIRRNLSVNPKFEKVPRKMGRGCLWVIKGGQHDIKDIEKEEESLIIENEEGVMDARRLVDVNKMKCLLCEKGFAYKNSLIKHAKAVHGKVAVPETVASEVSGNKMLQCNFCDESFTVVGHWAKHMQQHSADFGLGPGQGSRPGTSRVGAKPKCSRMDTINTEEVVLKNRTKAKCHYCGEGFESRKLLLRHKLSSHKDNMRTSFLAFYLDKTSVPCGVALDGDGAGETARVLDCECCDNQTFINVGGWVRHMQHHKGEPGVHIPEVQEYHDLLKDYNRTVKREWAQRHKRKHKRKEGKFICHLCGAVMVRSAQYYHLQSVHKIGATDYTCEVCGKVDQCKYKHQQHVRTHSNEKRFVCPHCGKAYKSKHGLAICGRRCTGVGVFECSTCSKTFTAKARLKFHEMLHQGIRPHECPLCHLTYTRRTNMTDHFKRVHKKRLSDVVAELQMQTDKKEERELIKDALLQEN